MSYESSAHIIYGVDLGEEGFDYYEFEERLGDVGGDGVAELMSYFIGEAGILFLKGTEITADYGSLVTDLPGAFKLDQAKADAFKALCVKLEIEEEPRWLLTFKGC